MDKEIKELYLDLANDVFFDEMFYKFQYGELSKRKLCEIIAEKIGEHGRMKYDDGFVRGLNTRKTICHICKEPLESEGSEFCSAVHRQTISEEEIEEIIKEGFGVLASDLPTRGVARRINQAIEE